MRWTRENPYFNGDDYFRDLIGEIDRARRSIDLQYYIFAADALGLRMVDALKRATRRGVRVHIVVDCFGSWDSIGWLQGELQNTGATVVVYHPFPWLQGFRRGSDLLRRNHRKVCVIDRSVAWVGGMNVDARHLREIAGDEAWRDNGVRVEGRPVRLLLWYGRKFRRKFFRTLPSLKRSSVTELPVRLNDRLLWRRQLNADLLQRIRKARNRVWITSAYFVPAGSVLRALKRAANSGADVRILVAHESDLPFMEIVAYAFFYGLLSSGVRIFRYFPRMLHAKNIIVDDWCVTGSSNFNHRSFLHDLEADVVLGKEESRRAFEEQFLLDLKSSHEITLQNWREAPILHRILAKALLLVRRML